MSTTWWIAQIILVIVSILGIIGVQQKRKSVILAFYTANTLLAAVAVAMLGSYSASIVLMILTALAITSHQYDIRNKKVPIWLILVFIFVIVSAGAVFIHQPADVISIFASVSYVIAIFQKKEANLRRFTLLYLCFWVTFDVLVFAAAAIVTDSIQVISTIIAIMRLDRKKRKKSEIKE